MAIASIRLDGVTKVYHDAPTRRGRATSGPGHRPAQYVGGLPSESAPNPRPDSTPDAGSHTDQVLALDHVDLLVNNGETVAILGPSGCGKSTLLRAVAGLVTYDGWILHDGRDITRIPEDERRIGMVFQDYALYPHFNARNNMRFYFQLHKVPDPETRVRIDVTSEIMGLDFKYLLARKPPTLSEGQKQRVAIARAIVREPHLLLFDEPLSNLDAKLRVQTRAEITQLLRRFRITTLYVTHDHAEAISVGDRIAVMRKGRIHQVGTFAEIMNEPSTAFVAGFVGTRPMNLFMEGVVGAGDVHLVDIPAVPLPRRIRDQAVEGRRLTVGIRPSAMTLGAPSHREGVWLRGVVEVVAPDLDRDSLLAHMRTGSATYVVESAMDMPIAPGETHEVFLPLDQLHFFDAATGGRIH